MRLLHVADWHLGRLTYNCPRAEDHDKVLSEIVDIARRFRPHLILHAGDLFDGVRPSYPDLHRGVAALQELAVTAPVVVLAGNHDSPALFQLFNQLIGDGGRIRFAPHALPPSQGGILEFPGHHDETIRLAPLPFVHPNRTIKHFMDSKEWMANYADQVGQIQNILAAGLLGNGYHPERSVLLFAAHLHVTGARISRSERQVHVEEDYATRVERVPPVTYAAYGHIHRPQPIPGAITGRYAGSPVALDFGEEGEDKSVVLVEAEPGRTARIEVVPLSGGRRLMRLEGSLDELRQKARAAAGGLCLVTVRTETPLSDLAARVAEALPGAVLLSVSEECAARRVTVLAEKEETGGEEPSFAELFREYLSAQGTRGAPADRVMALFHTLIRAVEEDAVPELPELSELETPLEPSSPGASR